MSTSPSKPQVGDRALLHVLDDYGEYTVSCTVRRIVGNVFWILVSDARPGVDDEPVKLADGRLVRDRRSSR